MATTSVSLNVGTTSAAAPAAAGATTVDKPNKKQQRRQTKKTKTTTTRPPRKVSVPAKDGLPAKKAGNKRAAKASSADGGDNWVIQTHKGGKGKKSAPFDLEKTMAQAEALSGGPVSLLLVNVGGKSAPSLAKPKATKRKKTGKSKKDTDDSNITKAKKKAKKTGDTETVTASGPAISD